MFQSRRFARVFLHLPGTVSALGTMLVGGCILASCLMGGLARAQVLIQPVMVEFSARQRVVAVTVFLSDKASAPMRLQAEVLRWQQDLQGQQLTEPSDDLLISPPIVDLQPGQRQVFRIAPRAGKASLQEQAYRLILEDVAEPASAGGTPQMAINFRMRYDLPVLIPPSTKVFTEVHWKPCPAQAASPLLSSQACVRLMNKGNRRVKVQALTVLGDGWQQTLTLKDGVNVLAGAEREWRVPLQPLQAGPLRGLQAYAVDGAALPMVDGGF